MFLVIGLVMAAPRVFGTVQTVNVSPSVLTVGQPITFSGVDVETISPNNPENAVMVNVYSGFGCSFSSLNSIAFTTTTIIPSGPYSGFYNTTLLFPALLGSSGQSYSEGWVVTSQSYEGGFPAGSYSVSVTDTEALANGAPGICKNFTIVGSSTTEFSDPLILVCSMLVFLSLLVRRRAQTRQKIVHRQRNLSVV